MELFITCPQGLEPLLAEELIELGVQSPSPMYCGVQIAEWNLATIYRINYCSRLASRVLYPLHNFRCRHAIDLVKEVQTISWGQYLSPKTTFVVDATSHGNDQLRNGLFVAQKVKDAICDQFKADGLRRPSIDKESPDVRIHLYLRGQQARLSLDTSGAPLSRRGYRKNPVAAPLSETLAAALLRLAAYNKDAILCDPCCGSGTILIEAAMLASNTPAGYYRKEWGFFHLPEARKEEFLRVKNEADQQRRPLEKNHFLGIDIDSEAIFAARSNATLAGFQNEILFVRGDFSQAALPIIPNLVVTNPPHGKRLMTEEQAHQLFKQLGDWMRQKIQKPGKGCIFTSNLELSKSIGLKASRRHVLHHSNEEARLLVYDLY